MMHINLSERAGACFRGNYATALCPPRAARLLFFLSQTLELGRARMIGNLKLIILSSGVGVCRI